MTAPTGLLTARVERLLRAPRASVTLDSWADPELVFLELSATSPLAYWLDAGPDAETGWSHIGDVGDADGLVARSEPDRAIVTLVRPITGEREESSRSFLELVTSGTDGLAADGDGPVALRWAGWLGYETGANLAGIEHAPVGTADSVMMHAPRQIAFDHARRRIHVSSLQGDPREERWLLEVVTAIMALVGRTAPEPPTAPAVASVRARHSPAEYRRMIERCQELIADGEAYQLCLTNRFETTTDESPLSVYRRLRRRNPTRHGAFIRDGEQVLLSSSPEVFLSVTATGEITTRPIKGTRRRGADAAEDAALRAELRGDEKELAENLMIVDLMRNDLAEVSELGSVAVRSLFDVEEHPNVFQLVSTIVGQLRGDRALGDLLARSFPAGSMTGAPKLAAMRILHDLERGPRGAYAGANGYIAADGSARLAMTIRSLVFHGARVTIGAGGGITALSRADAEIDEVFTKSAPLLAALGAGSAAVAGR
jgi:para-aminobenzoate synthetase component 1